MVLDLNKTVIIEVRGGLVVDWLVPGGIEDVVVVDRDNLETTPEEFWPGSFSEDTLEAKALLDSIHANFSHE